MAVITLLFTGCQKNTKITPKSVFEADFTLLYNEMQIKGELSVKEDELVEIKVNSPDALKNLKVSANGGNFSVDYNGIKVSYNENDLPDTAFFKLLSLSLKNILKAQELEFEKVDEKYKATVSSSLGEIKITLNKDFYIENLQIPSHGFNLKLQVKTPS